MEQIADLMEKRLEMSLLYDFYGELLKEHQKQIFEDYACNDLSFQEIAENTGISRQGIFDMVKRCYKQLEEYEEKLHLIDKFRETKLTVIKIRELAQKDAADSQVSEKIVALSEQILELL